MKKVEIKFLEDIANCNIEKVIFVLEIVFGLIFANFEYENLNTGAL